MKRYNLMLRPDHMEAFSEHVGQGNVSQAVRRLMARELSEASLRPVDYDRALVSVNEVLALVDAALVPLRQRTLASRSAAMTVSALDRLRSQIAELAVGGDAVA